MRDKIHLVLPDEEHEAQAMEYVREHREQGELVLHGGGMLETKERYSDWLVHTRALHRGEPPNPDWVPSTMFFGIREGDGRIVGTIDIRHFLNDYLRSYGGNIGYGVRPSERRKGYATAMLEQALDYCREELQLDRVMLSCNKANPASARTIQGRGGVLEREFLHDDGMTVQVYWIELT